MTRCKLRLFLNFAGPRVLEVYDNFVWGDVRDKDKPANVLEALERYRIPRDNDVIEPQVLQRSILRTV